MSTTEISLSGNALKRVQPYQFFGRFRLGRIDLSHNNLAFIEEHSFNGLVQLKTLALSHNELQILLGYEFKDLGALEFLHLDHNRIQFVSNATFATLVSLQYLNLMGNPLRHLMETRVYFEFNLNLVNLSVDRNLLESGASVSGVAVPASGGSNSLVKKRKLSGAVKRLPEGWDREPNYSDQIRTLLSSKYTSELVDCILAKYKQGDFSKIEIFVIYCFATVKEICV